ncbi:T9SS type A sorting domain-containing protein [Flavobacterium sp.]|uniref:T9SS type A sorting domain-containing protein n=1 Tax=Flavobacterium sp. TaxID=239 RepID=UPI00333ED71C
MKKITFLFTFLISILGFSQNLVSNGDFQTGTALPWTGNAANVQDLGSGNWVNQADVAVPGNAYDVNLSQEINLVDGKTYKLKFDAFTATATGTRTIICGLGQTGAPFAALTSTITLTPNPQTFTFEYTINYGNTVSDRVIFDMGAATGFVFIDNVSVVEVLPLIQNFENAASYTAVNGFQGASASLVADPFTGGTNGQVFRGVQISGSAPAVQTYQGIEFQQTIKKAKLTTNKTMSVDVFCSQPFNVLAKVAQGGAGVPESATAQAYTTPGQWQTLTFNFAVPMDNTGVANGEYEKIIFFGNWNSGNTGFNNPIVPLTFYVDNIRAEEAAFPLPPAGPSVAAPTPPARNAWDVISLFSNAYNNIAIAEWGTSWDTASISDLVSVPGDDIKRITYGDFIAVQFANYENATSMTNFHMDYFITAGTDLVGKVLNPKFSNHAAMAGETNAILLTHLPTTAGSWFSIDVALSSMSPQGPGVAFARQNLLQFLMQSNLGIVYVDNIYLYRAATASADTFNTSNVRLYPNPTSTSLTIEAKDAIESISIYNVLGQEVISKNPMSSTMTLDVSNLQNGLYFVNSTIDGKTATTKFIKN